MKRQMHYDGGVHNAHTPGPWDVGMVNEKAHFVCTVPNDGTFIPIARVFAISLNGHGTALHNACLMACAPDLLQTAKEMLACLDVFDGLENEHILLREKVRSIIAKAEGRE